MNNSLVLESDEKEVDTKPQLRERESELVNQIQALDEVNQSEAWKVLEGSIFGPLVETLEKRIKTEVEKVKIDEAELYRLQGQKAWAKKYADLSRLSEILKTELKAIKQRLQ